MGILFSASLNSYTDYLISGVDFIAIVKILLFGTKLLKYFESVKLEGSWII